MTQLIRPHNPAKAFLSRYRAIRAQYASAAREIEDLRASLTGITAPIRSDVVTGSGPGDRMADTVARIADMEAQLADTVREMSGALTEITCAINAVPDAMQRAVLYLRYIEGLGWPRICEQISYSERQTFVIHGRALIAVNEWLSLNAEKVLRSAQDDNRVGL